MHRQGAQYNQFHDLQSFCQIDLERCVGCEVCVHIPGKKTNPYDLKVCPWDAIEMVKTEEVAHVVAKIGGPPEYIYENWDRLVGTAHHLAEHKATERVVHINDQNKKASVAGPRLFLFASAESPD